MLNITRVQNRVWLPLRHPSFLLATRAMKFVRPIRLLITWMLTLRIRPVSPWSFRMKIILQTLLMHYPPSDRPHRKGTPVVTVPGLTVPAWHTSIETTTFMAVTVMESLVTSINLPRLKVLVVLVVLNILSGGRTKVLKQPVKGAFSRFISIEGIVRVISGKITDRGDLRGLRVRRRLRLLRLRLLVLRASLRGPTVLGLRERFTPRSRVCPRLSWTFLLPL